MEVRYAIRMTPDVRKSLICVAMQSSAPTKRDSRGNRYPTGCTSSRAPPRLARAFAALARFFRMRQRTRRRQRRRACCADGGEVVGWGGPPRRALRLK